MCVCVKTVYDYVTRLIIQQLTNRSDCYDDTYCRQSIAVTKEKATKNINLSKYALNHPTQSLYLRAEIIDTVFD